jgi:hypothetical protein
VVSNIIGGGDGAASTGFCDASLAHAVWLYRNDLWSPFQDQVFFGTAALSSIADLEASADLSFAAGNISTDPELVDLEGLDFHLQAGSPCKDAGAIGYDQDDHRDIDGEARPTGGWDIGVDELAP